MDWPTSKRIYRSNPDFEPREPTAAEFHSYCTLEEYSLPKLNETFDLMRENGAQSYRVTMVNAENPRPPYPHGYWFEGWRDELANQLPFGEAETPGGAISPPLATQGMEPTTAAD